MNDEEEKEFEGYVLGGVVWEVLPPAMKKKFENSKEIWKERVIRFSIKHQLGWKKNIVRSFIDERAYYTEMLKYSKQVFMVQILKYHQITFQW
jgi:hypothetical protein